MCVKVSLKRLGEYRITCSSFSNNFGCLVNEKLKKKKLYLKTIDSWNLVTNNEMVAFFNIFVC